VRDVSGFRDPLTGAQVPPQIGIDRMACRHGQQAEQKNAGKRPFPAEFKNLHDQVSATIIESDPDVLTTRPQRKCSCNVFLCVPLCPLWFKICLVGVPLRNSPDTISDQMKPQWLSGRWQRWLAAFLLAMAIAHLVVAWQERTLMARSYGDFSALYTAGLMVRRGMGHQLYDRHEQWKIQQEFASQVVIRQGPMPFIRPPFEALFFVPFAYLTYPAALAVWSALKFAFLWLALRMLPRKNPFLRIYPAWLEAILCLGFFPVFLDFYQGQDAVLLLLFVVLAFHCLDRERDTAAGVFLAAGLFKFHLVIPILLILILVGRPRVLAGFVPVALALLAVSCAVAGTGVLYVYPGYLLELNRAAGIGMVTAQSMPNLRGMLTAWVGRAPYPGPIHWILLPVAIAALGYTVRIWRSRTQSGFTGLTLGYSLAIVMTILTSYYAYSYDMTLLLVPLLLIGMDFLNQPHFLSVSRRLLLAASLLLICAPLYWALILRWDRPYLLCLPLLLLAAGLIGELRELTPASA
jgi:glycosyl transferase family 87